MSLPFLADFLLLLRFCYLTYATITSNNGGDWRKIATPFVENHDCNSTVSYLIEAEWRMYASLNWVVIDSDNGVLPVRRQAIIRTNAGIFLTLYVLISSDGT